MKSKINIVKRKLSFSTIKFKRDIYCKRYAEYYVWFQLAIIILTMLMLMCKKRHRKFEDQHSEVSAFILYDQIKKSEPYCNRYAEYSV